MLNVLLIQIEMAFYYLNLLLSMVHVVQSSRDHLKLIIQSLITFHRCSLIVYFDTIRAHQCS